MFLPRFICLFVVALFVGGLTEGEAKSFVIALDIGHTPQRPGAIGAEGTSEYQFNRNIVRLLAERLSTAEGLEARIVNAKGGEISLIGRSRAAKAMGADLLLAIHHDSVNKKYLVRREVNGRVVFQTDNIRGFSVFFSEKNPQAEASRRFAELLGEAMKGAGFSPTDHHAEKIPGENRPLLRADIGLYQFDDLVVLKTASMPAVLLECGVIANPAEAAELKRPEYQQKIVHAVISAVTKFARER